MPKECFYRKRLLYGQFRKMALDMGLRRSLIVLGPRRVGKTVMLMQLVGETIKSGMFKPDHVCYADMDHALLRDLTLWDIVQAVEKRAGSRERSLLIFDEIQACADWERDLKAFTDHHLGIQFVASGSIAAALKRKSSESGFGRFVDLRLPPVLFHEFLHFRGGLPESLPSTSREVREARLNKEDVARLNKFFMRYLEAGSFPEALKAERIAIPRDSIVKSIDKDLFGKHAVDYGISADNKLFPLLQYIARHQGEEMSLTHVSQNTDIDVKTLNKYLEFLQAAFLVRRVRKRDTQLRELKRQAMMKLVLENPAMHSVLSGTSESRQSGIGNRIEAAAFAQYQVPSMFSVNLYRDEIRYIRNKVNYIDREVDMVHCDGARKITRLAEIKWSDHAGRLDSAASNLEFFHGRGPISRDFEGLYCTTKSTYRDLHEGNVTFLPTAQYCLSLGMEALEELPEEHYALPDG